jgi:hypothetical protein
VALLVQARRFSLNSSRFLSIAANPPTEAMDGSFSEKIGDTTDAQRSYRGIARTGQPTGQ